MSLLLSVAEAYRLDNGICEMKTVSSRVFGDSKTLRKLSLGSDITLGRFNAAMIWFRDNWPEAAPPPAELLAYVPPSPECLSALRKDAAA